MSADSRFNIAEITRESKDVKRTKDHKHKWAYGARPLPGRRPSETAGEKTRPRLPDPHYRDNLNFDRHPYNSNKATASIRQTLRYDVADEMMHPSDSSADEEIREASAAPVPDADIAYSYDAQHGPGRGSQILSMALTQAVERFETKETEKLINNEYEVVVKEGEHGDGYAADEDDDFELV